MLDFRRADSQRESAERAVRGCVGISADDGRSRQCEPELWPDDVDDALLGALEVIEADAKLAAKYAAKPVDNPDADEA